jgi:hypothetical protein
LVFGAADCRKLLTEKLFALLGAEGGIRPIGGLKREEEK